MKMKKDSAMSKKVKSAMMPSYTENYPKGMTSKMKKMHEKTEGKAMRKMEKMKGMKS